VTGGVPGAPAREAAATNRGVALLRLALVPIALVVDLPDRWDVAFAVVVALFAAYAVTLLVAGALTRRHLPAAGQAIADLVWIATLVYVTGGADSPLRFAFYVMPVAAAVRLSPRLTAMWLALALATYLLVAVPHPRTDVPADLDFIAEQAVALLWVGTGAVMLSALLGHRERSLAALAEARRLLVRHALDAEARERRRLAEALHDDALQNLLVARQEVADAAAGVPGATDRARAAIDATGDQLRREVLAMHPLGPERAGLAAAVTGIARGAERRGGFRAHVTVDPSAAGRHDELVIATVRELVSNAATHAAASNVTVSVTADPHALRLTVADDGNGLPHGRPERALEEGHIGLAVTTERVRAAGGDIGIESGPGAGTTVTVVLPSPARG
jgi:two-component system, NarL family, sensor kinase